MMVSIDGKVTGKFLFDKASEEAGKLYFKMENEFEHDAYACGRATFEEYLVGKTVDLAPFAGKPVERVDKVYTKEAKLFAVSFDGKGKLPWTSDTVPDNAYGGGGEKIIQVLTDQASDQYIAYLQSIKCNYIIAGKDTINVKEAVEKLHSLFGIKNLLLEGGSVINGSFLRENLVDEINVIYTPVTAESDGKPLFFDSVIREFKLDKVLNENGTAVLRFSRKES